MKLKDEIKINIFPPLVSFLHALGISWEKLGSLTFFNKSVLLAQAKFLGNFIVEKNNNPQNIYFLTMLPGGTFHLLIESLFALGLKKRGHNVTIVIDDNTLPVTEYKNVKNYDEWSINAETDFKYASKFLRKLKLDFVSVSEFIKDADNLMYQEKYASILEASLLKHYKVGIINDKLLDVKNRTELFKKSIGITNYIGEKLVGVKPDVVIMSHGIYSTWGPPYELLNSNNIPILIYGRAKQKHTLKFDWNRTGNSWDVGEEWNKVKNLDLTEGQLRQIIEYIDTRVMHKDDITVFNFGSKTAKKETMQFLGLDANKPVYSLFTNVLWDAASAQREIAFKNPVEWVIETIEWFNKHPEKQLIVKIHPAEIIIGTNMPFYDIIHSAVTPKDNIKIIKPDAKVNSWSIYDITDLGLVHTTTAGMELPLVDKPCMVVSQTHYRGKGFTIDVNSKREYFKILESFNSKEHDLAKNKKEALKYSYLLFIRYPISFDLFYESTLTDIKGFKETDMNKYLLNKNYNNIIKSIEEKKPLFSQ